MIEFYDKFKELGLSNKTNYDWSTISDHVRHIEVTSESEVTAPAGTIIQVRQVVGTCGQGTIRTEAVKTKQTISTKMKHCEAEEKFKLIIQCDASNDVVSLCRLPFQKYLINTKKN